MKKSKKLLYFSAIYAILYIGQEARHKTKTPTGGNKMKTEKKLERINAIKTGKFGVEVEMYNITRRQAAYVIANLFGTGFSVCHDGGVYDKYTFKDAQGRKWTMMSDSSIRDIPERRCEMVTPVLGYEDIEELQEVIRALRHAGAKADPAHECGVHIHVDAEGQTPKTLKSLANLMNSYDTIVMNAIGVDSQRREWCRPVDERFVEAINKKSPKTMEDVRMVWYESQGYTVDCMFEHYNASRYNILNLHSLWQGKGIEFRCFQFDNPTADRKGGLHAGQLKAYIQLCLAICGAAQRKAYPHNITLNLQETDPRKAIYGWLLRLGFFGDEFKTAREVFTKNLERRTRVAA